MVILLRFIAFEYFRGSPSLLGKKLTQITTDCLYSRLSLTLFRETTDALNYIAAEVKIECLRKIKEFEYSLLLNNSEMGYLFNVIKTVKYCNWFVSPSKKGSISKTRQFRDNSASS